MAEAEGRPPLNRLVAAYAAVAAVALLFPHRPAAWPVHLAVHLALILALLRPRLLRPLTEPLARRAPGVTRALAGWYPLLIIPLLYSEIPTLNTAVWDGRYFDPLLMGWEEAVFGGQPSLTLAYRAHWLPLSEALHLAYFSYYPIIYFPPLFLWLRGKLEAFRITVFAVALAFLAHYVVFIYFPVQGPFFLFPTPNGGLDDGPFYRLVHWVLDVGASRGAAFPSSHVAVAVAQTVCALRFQPRVGAVLVVLSIGLAVGTIYGGFHYALDALAGAAAGLGIGLAVLRRYRVAR